MYRVRTFSYRKVVKLQQNFEDYQDNGDLQIESYFMWRTLSSGVTSVAGWICKFPYLQLDLVLANVGPFCMFGFLLLNNRQNPSFAWFPFFVNFRFIFFSRFWECNKNRM